MKMHFILNKVTRDFAALLRRRHDGDGDSGEIWTVVDLYISEGMNIPEDPTFQQPTNHMDNLALDLLSPKIIAGLFKIADLLDGAASIAFDSDDDLETHLRAYMKADTDMTAAKAFLKSFYQKDNSVLHYPTQADLAARSADTFRRFLTVGRKAAGAGSIYGSSFDLLD